MTPRQMSRNPRIPSTSNKFSGANCPVYQHPERLITKIESGEKTSWAHLLFGKSHE